mmetsp:Transcript_16005/g.34817  ORF Transcript_16005/g.34817 Transcript_16005/m.34817 type:complete len:264 (+) Transcript_16005:61-852(+)|eukprot:CAMPEP_0178567832 /NCGR_PEP_ID=MMETSP0697-20121206/15547_1 /TAXON_ID=265572 /ORGANISM="Extubocellulus spinifer, Strain CCMP396" /LENGTH=263 /DNA_ID=CAMNT_0020201815 /DNA_START=56 /DNA_END=847 /DNA_ORIENTATION=+
MTDVNIESRNVLVGYEFVHLGSRSIALASADEEIASCVGNILAGGNAGILSISPSGRDTVYPSGCTVLAATDGTSCALADGVLLATYDLDLLDYEAATDIVTDAAYQCLDDETLVVAAVENIVEMKFVDRKFAVGEASILQDRATPDSGGMSNGGVAGIVILVAALLAGIALLAYRHRSKNKKDQADDEEEAAEEGVVATKDLEGDFDADTTVDMDDMSPDSPGREAAKEAVLEEIDDVIASIETDMKVQEGGEAGDEFEVAL